MASRFSVEAQFKAIDSLTKPISKMQRRIKKFAALSARRVAKIGKALKKAGAVMGKAFIAGTAIAAAAIGAVVLKTAALGDEAAKTGRLLGITAESLQELRFAADRQGVSNSTLNSSFIALQKRVGELKSGTGSLFSFLKKTGDEAFAVQIAGAKDTGEAFDLIVKKINTIEDPLKKAAFASAAFSRSGIKMLNFIEAGEEGIKKLREEARKYGAVISNEAAEQSELFVDSLTNLKASLTGVGTAFATKITPFLTDAAQRFAEFWALNRDIIGLGMDSFLSAVGDTFKAIKPGVIALFLAVKNLFSAFTEAIGSLLPEFSGETLKFSDVVNTLTDSLKFLADIGIKAFDFIRSISPFLKPFLAVLLTYQGILLAIGLVTKAWGVAQVILNAILSANPISLIVIGIAALIAIIVLLIDNWDAVVSAFKTGALLVGDFISGILDNPFFTTIGLIFLPFITIPALIIKHWTPITEFFIGLWNKLEEVFSSGIEFIKSLIGGPILSTIGGLFKKFGFTFNGENNQSESATDSPTTAPAGGLPASSPQAVTQAASTQRILSESRETSTAELLIRDETGRAELRNNSPLAGVKIAMSSSGGA